MAYLLKFICLWSVFPTEVHSHEWNKHIYFLLQTVSPTLKDNPASFKYAGNIYLPRTLNGERIFSATNEVGKLDNHIEKNEIGPYLIPLT